MNNKKGALEISFGWLFAIIAGVFIIFLAIYFATKLFGTEKETIVAKTGKEIGILLNPLEISFEAAKTVSITMPADTRIYNICDNKGVFGKQLVQLSQKSFNKWTDTDIKTTFYNKYIFSEKQTEGTTFYFFSKPFDFPFKVADLLYMTSAKQRYCFVNPPSDVREEISLLQQDNLLTQNCLDTNIRVCFNSNSNCDIDVDYESGIVEKNGTDMSFVISGEENDENALMYAAIFSTPEVYECQVKRLMQRLKELSLLYKDKESIAEGKGCGNEVGSSLIELSNIANQLSSSRELESIKSIVNSVNSQNKIAKCTLW
ncbi:MAG: hypothetical protein NTU63_02160 [Candidatus Pacearchaeota archaeon]|nr:hypothetical protein [Candidatus Pacearchaeota archaeon]